MDTLIFNTLEVRLAQNAAEIDAAQALRYRIFYQEMGALPTPAMRLSGRDCDPYDEICDHLLVIDRARSTLGAPCVVGTYRMLRRTIAEASAGFYSEDEFQLTPLFEHPGEVLELGRSCIDPDYRKRNTMQLLWRGIAEYINVHDIDIMFGCASIPGDDPTEMKLPLSYLHHYHKAPKTLRPRAVAHRYVDMDMIKKKRIDVKRALNELPPLIKGYLRLGGFIGDGAVIDHQFNTVDVCILVETTQVTEKYLRHYSRDKLPQHAAAPIRV
ncbi:GNAT family N-acetyltransferase [Varunaivibrio sulfuroxidans]|uniref:L-ornithine N(alpha)-acyltransferase n=1 Tax=Varunaivibrio sulfuroxidans TaxID=1773489 RepID=A0A4R3JCQ6_9PROT|nr:GNAT family N-acyltransferase [Varunaivibrio sulfuroxidans]TCS63542.1 ornithine-acyl[acyl carrier protein] N-acyltransferase [Varunaivibrio sulfuroxidans]WES30313.1 GNAT family N-acetyltransferase [Varunaivibrio sulfuroxidans]